jgi:hypothetical protein
MARSRRRHSLLRYAGLRPEETLALQRRHVRERTLLVEQAVSDGELKGQKTNRPPRTVDLLAPLKQDLAEWRLASGRPPRDASLFPSATPTRPWRDHDYRNWRKRHFRPAPRRPASRTRGPPPAARAGPASSTCPCSSATARR